MSLLQSTSVLQGLGFSHRDETPKSKSSGLRLARKELRPASSLANLVQFARNPVEIASTAAEDWYDGSTKEERAERQALADQKQLLYIKMRNAITYADWQAAATELDEVEGNNEWKCIEESLEYDVHLVQARLEQLDEARISCDIGRMLFLIRTALTRDLGDMGNLKMYKHTHIGTKDLIERYISSALETLNALLDVSGKAKCDGMESKYILEQVLSARQAFGRSALLLSGGATFGMNHIGVIKALWDAKLLPRIISGASAGSIVCAVVCTRTDEEIPDLMDSFCDGDLAVFEEDGNEDGMLRKAARFLTHGALYDISHLTRVMKDMVGDMTFQEAYNRTRKILNICVSSASLYELPRLLNYITAPNVLIWSAVAASCSVPFIYTAAALLAKDPKTGEAVPWNPSPQRWIDGSVDNDIPMTRLAEMFNVNHFIVSQVNPHVVPFLVKDEDAIGEEVKKSNSKSLCGPTWLNNLSHLAKGEALYRMHTLADLGVFPNLLTKTVSVLSQKYSGDITIFPEISYADFPRMLSNPTKEFMSQSMLSGEQATWPRLSIIRNHCAIELALDDAVQRLRARVAFSPSEVKLRTINHKRQTSDVRKTRSTRTKARRPVSQNSTSSAPLPGKMSLHTHKQNASGRLLPTIRHKKSQSLNTVTLEPSSCEFSYNENPELHDFLNPKTVQDVTSSGPDEPPNLTTSTSSTSISSPMDSPSSPIDPASKWPHSLFTSSSQPSTPTPAQDSSYFDTRRSPFSPRAVFSKFSMTPTQSFENTVLKSPDEPPRYKQLFHHRSHEQASSKLPGKNKELLQPGASPDLGLPRVSKKRNWALEIDIPAATKNFMSRGKKGGNVDA